MIVYFNNNSARSFLIASIGIAIHRDSYRPKSITKIKINKKKKTYKVTDLIPRLQRTFLGMAFMCGETYMIV